jgi:PAS domain S-box-containing protein
VSDATSTARSIVRPAAVTPTAVLITRHDRVEFVNPATARLMATPADLLVGRTTGELFADDSHREVAAQVGQLPPEHGLLTGPVVGRLARADGTSPRVEVTATSLAADRGPGILWFLRDLDEPTDEQQRATEAALVASQHRLQLFVEYAPAALAMFDRDMRYIVASRRWRADYRLPDAGLIGRSHYDVFPQIPDEWKAAHRRALSGETVTAEEDRFVQADGAVRWLRWEVRPWIGPGGHVEGIVAFSEDITERKMSEEKLRDRDHRLQAVLDTATDGILTIDGRGTVESVNPSAERLFGYPAAELVGRNVCVLMPPPYAAEHDGYLARYLRTGERRIIGFGREVSGRRKDGTVFPIELAVTELPGTPRRFTGFIRDITDRKQLEARFLRAQRLESLGALASGVAHDLNNVLTPVLMAVKLLLKDKPGGTRQAILETALASIERGTGIVRQLLAFGGGVPGEKAAVVVAEVVREVVGMMEHTLPKSITLASDLPADLWSVTGDVTQLSQLLVNLCVNARDAMPGGGEIRIAAENFPVDAAYAARYPGARPGRYVLLTVADTGTGIPPQVQERMFDPFFTTKPFGQGTGLGLATVQGIVKAHGGFVTVYSEVGRGAKFLIHLPAAAEAEPSVKPGMAASLPGRGRLVLVVDDEPAVRLMARATLEEAGYRVADAGDGEAALAAYRAGEVDAVVLDMMMPGLDTPTVIRRLRQLHPTARILAVSGLHPTGQAAAVLREFAVPFLTKPFTDDALLAALDRLHHPNPG